MEEIQYKLSQFNIVDKYNDTTFLIFNSASGALISLDSSKFNSFTNLIANDEMTTSFIQNGFWVDKREDELFYQKAKRQIAVFTEKNNKHIVIAPTMKCNARCYYCYEQGRETPTMTDEVVNGVVDFLVKYTQKAESLNLSWFGGEPLLGEAVIDKIIASLKTRISIPITSTMTTNGSLLNDRLIEKMVNSWQLKTIQITLDGCKEYYSKVKNYYNGNQYYEKILGNIQKLSDNSIKVSIRINLSCENVDEAERLIDYLNERFYKNANIDVYYMPLVQYSDEKDPRIIERDQDLENICRRIFGKLKQGKSNYVDECNFRDRTLPCAAVTEDFFIIDPTGTLYKCQHDIGEKTQSVGDVFHGVLHNKIMSEWCFSALPAKCCSCNYLPMCQGGCKKSNNKCFFTKYLIYDYMKEMYERSINK